jgi:DNA-binding CsgD family transcriptional regulator
MVLPHVEKRNDSIPEGVIDIKNKLIKAMDIKKLHICDIRGEDVVITKKELECIKWMMLGKSSSEIAMIMGVSLTTVNTHIKNMKVKIGLFKIGQLIKFFCKNQFDCLYS